MLRTFLNRTILQYSNPFTGNEKLTDKELMFRSLKLRDMMDKDIQDNDMVIDADLPDPPTFSYEELRKKYKWANWQLTDSNKHILPHQIIGTLAFGPHPP